MSNQLPIIIIGAGISGLTAAQHLKKNNIPFLILEADNSIGGRVKTELVNGFQLDIGFQVLIAGYPAFENGNEVNLANLKLGSFASGAKIFHKEGCFTISDPFRHPQHIFSTQLAPFVKAKDALLLWKLRKMIKNLDPEVIFDNYSDISTIDFLNDFGFSTDFIEAFLMPFYSGIFLEPSLATPASMFCFIFKMLSENKAVLPVNGIGQLADELSRAIPSDCIKMGVKVVAIKDGVVTAADGSTYLASKVLITSAPLLNQLFPNSVKINFHHTINMYFELDAKLPLGKFIGLNPDKKMLVNSFCMPSVVQSTYAPKGKHLLSVTLNSHVKWNEDLPFKVMAEINLLTRRHNQAKFIKYYQIDQALPQVPKFKYLPDILYPASNVLAAGDFTANGSVNSAILAGRLLAAQMM